ncbi:hypothetical protein B0H14DRAFT_3518530 [Mycena olivaceomarginata]|nr:hypothetical protein B0H14DRAFT_3518530 [Mycena olivaceomarginata]
MCRTELPSHPAFSSPLCPLRARVAVPVPYLPRHCALSAHPSRLASTPLPHPPPVGCHARAVQPAPHTHLRVGTPSAPRCQREQRRSTPSCRDTCAAQRPSRSCVLPLPVLLPDSGAIKPPASLASQYARCVPHPSRHCTRCRVASPMRRALCTSLSARVAPRHAGLSCAAPSLHLSATPSPRMSTVYAPPTAPTLAAARADRTTSALSPSLLHPFSRCVRIGNSARPSVPYSALRTILSHILSYTP